MKNTELRSTARQPGLRFRDYLLERQRPRSNHASVVLTARPLFDGSAFVRRAANPAPQQIPRAA